jgi:cell division protein FtsW (lipid II flippase)
MKRVGLRIIALFCFLASAYSFLGLIMIADFSVDPNYPPERVEFNANFWGSSTIIFFLLGVVFLLLIWKSQRKPDRLNLKTK